MNCFDVFEGALVVDRFCLVSRLDDTTEVRVTHLMARRATIGFLIEGFGMNLVRKGNLLAISFIS